MSDLDITPPPVPGKRKEGFLKKFFLKEEKTSPPDIDEIKRKLGLEDSPAAQPQSAPQTEVKHNDLPDIDEIKEKLGITDDMIAAAPPAPATPPPAPQQTAKVEVHDWTADAHAQAPAWTPTKVASPWDAELEVTQEEIAADELRIDEPPAHHEMVEQHLEPLAKEHEKAEKTLLLADQRPQVPEWSLQDKEITPDQYFILRNGQPVRSLKELIDALDYIDDTTFAHHVNEYRNDFANWIRDVINDGDLADEIQAAETKPEMVKALLTHEKNVAKQLQKDHEKIQQVVKKREQTMKKLLTVEEQIAQLKEKLEEKSRELTGERKAKEKLIKDKLDAEVKRRLEAQKHALTAARQELAAAKKEYLLKTREVEQEKRTLADREKSLLLSQHRNTELLDEIKQQRQKLHEEKREATDILKDAAHLRKQWEEMKKVDLQTRQNLEEISKRQDAVARAEETLRQRETKVASDLTKLHEQQERLRELKTEHDRREAQVKKAEADAARFTADAQQRTAAALETERASRERIKADLKKLDGLRKQIDTSLAKVMKNKQKLSTAVALRKHLEESVLKMRGDVATDRKAMEEDSYKAYMQTKDAVTPAGQPDMSHADDVEEVTKTQLPIYAKVEECRSALDRHDLETAKRIYGELRHDYASAKLDPSEKSVLYNSIRELYDDIHLAMLG